ncbi:MAG: FtsW/RodA/SpoVE family cell cycle protein, partial [Methylocella sp.]
AGRRRDVPANLVAVLLLLVTIVPLILQPDFGQTLLVALVWAALFVVAGLPWFWVAGIGGAGLGGALLAYKLVPHVRTRVLKFIDPGAGGGMAETFQVDTALDSFLSGGWFGKGPGEGTIKRILPDAHTDFIFAVTGEEFGVLACLLIAALFAFIVLRGLVMAARNEDPFCRFAAAGLVILFGLQSAINMAVNVHLIPAKGMTLPFISYGGSSLISLGLAIGLLIAVMRKRPGAAILAGAGAEALP